MTLQRRMLGDRALSPGNEDRLGFAQTAKHIAEAILHGAPDDGFVIGLEGKWGSGKSSLLSLVAQDLLELPKADRPTVISFSPWLVGTRDTLLMSLFLELTTAIDDLSASMGNSSGKSLAKAKSAAAAMRAFTLSLSRAGEFVEVVGDYTATAPVKWIGKTLKSAGVWAGKGAAEPSLSKSKDKLSKALQDLGKRIVITIDDLDRLEPAEIVEVLRLVRSVVDLPNLIYVLCYDTDAIANSIQSAAQIENGRDFLEKIVQFTIMVPVPEPFRLRHWFASELQKIPHSFTEDGLSRLRSVIDFEGGKQLRTPRAVVRTLDSLRFLWPSVEAFGGDFSDLVWLQLIKDGNPKLYRWIENYFAVQSAVIMDITSADDHLKSETIKELMEAFPDSRASSIAYRIQFADQFLGLSARMADDGEPFKSFEKITPLARDSAIRNRRISSPDHHRLYFAFDHPVFALSQSEYNEFWLSLDQGLARSTEEFLLLYKLSAFDSLSKADVLLERLAVTGEDILHADRVRALMLVFSDALDEAFRIRSFDRFWINSIWDRAERNFAKLLCRLRDHDRADTLEKMFGSGRAMGWLTHILRRETFAHGFHGDQRRQESEWILSEAEFQSSLALMLSRFNAYSFNDVMESIDPLSLLYAWHQGGDIEGPKNLVNKSIGEDEKLIRTLEAFSSEVNSSSRGRYFVLKRSGISEFIDFDTARIRVEKLAETDTSEMVHRAKILAARFKDGESD